MLQMMAILRLEGTYFFDRNAAASCMAPLEYPKLPIDRSCIRSCFLGFLSAASGYCNLINGFKRLILQDLKILSRFTRLPKALLVKRIKTTFLQSCRYCKNSCILPAFKLNEVHCDNLLLTCVLVFLQVKHFTACVIVPTWIGIVFMRIDIFFQTNLQINCVLFILIIHSLVKIAAFSLDRTDSNFGIPLPL